MMKYKHRVDISIPTIMNILGKINASKSRFTLNQTDGILIAFLYNFKSNIQINKF